MISSSLSFYTQWLLGDVPAVDISDEPISLVQFPSCVVNIYELWPRFLLSWIAIQLPRSSVLKTEGESTNTSLFLLFFSGCICLEFKYSRSQHKGNSKWGECLWKVLKVWLGVTFVCALVTLLGVYGTFLSLCPWPVILGGISAWQPSFLSWLTALQHSTGLCDSFWPGFSFFIISCAKYSSSHSVFRFFFSISVSTPLHLLLYSHQPHSRSRRLWFQDEGIWLAWGSWPTHPSL